ncbi:unnamed protein product [Choristocarpus tenellus]
MGLKNAGGFILAITMSSTAEAFMGPIQVRPAIVDSRGKQAYSAVTTMSAFGPMERGVFFRSIAASTFGSVLVQGLAPEVAVAVKQPPPDYSKVREDIAAIIDKEPDRGPTFVRLAWHSSGTYDRISKTGGSQGGTIRFKDELSHGANAGLYKAVEWLQPVKNKYKELSFGDLYTLAGVVAIEKMGGPKIKWRSGRTDTNFAAVTPDGRLPAADKGNPTATAQGLRDVFYRMGFNDQEIVALSGAHALGRCHPNASGYDGPWTPTPNQFAGAIYFKLLKSVKWTPREWKGPFQYSDPSGSLMMLPSDIVLLQDSSFAKYVDMYAADDKKFFADFADAFSTLLELGTVDLVDNSLTLA